MTAVREINDPDELTPLAPLWSELLERTPGASFFHSLEWLQVYWKHFGARKRLRVLVVDAGAQGVGILPLVVRPARRSEPCRALTYPLDGWGNYYSPIGPEPQATLVAGLDHVRRTPRDWHFIELGWVDALADKGLTGATLAGAGFHATCETQNTCAIIDLKALGSWEAYLASRSKTRRKNLRRKEKKLAERGEVTYLRHRTNPTDGPDADPRLDLYDACVEIARKSWQGSSRTGTALSKGRARAFYRDSYMTAVRFGAADLNLMLVDGRPAAFDFAYHYRGHVCVLKTGYDPAFTDEGVGTILQARGIADSFARGDHTYDLGPEFMEYKCSWLTHEAPVYRYTHFPRHAVGAQTIRAKRAIVHWWRTQRAAAGSRPYGKTKDAAAVASTAASNGSTRATQPCETVH